MSHSATHQHIVSTECSAQTTVATTDNCTNKNGKTNNNGKKQTRMARTHFPPQCSLSCLLCTPPTFFLDLQQLPCREWTTRERRKHCKSRHNTQTAGWSITKKIIIHRHFVAGQDPRGKNQQDLKTLNTICAVRTNHMTYEYMKKTVFLDNSALLPLNFYCTTDLPLFISEQKVLKVKSLGPILRISIMSHCIDIVCFSPSNKSQGASWPAL